MTKSTAVNEVAARRGKSLTQIVQDEIERMIIAGEIDSGQRLNEQQIASQLGVSRGPVREALRGLESSGLIVGLPNLGMFVRSLDVWEVVELYELRAVLFGFACACVAERAKKEHIDVLREQVAQMDEVVQREDFTAYYQLNLAFHEKILEFSDRPRTVAIYQSLVKESHLFRRRVLVSPSSMAISNKEHVDIVDAIASGDPAVARTAGEHHHTHGKQRWLNTLGRRD
jgi:DNA-binding GntR family transcriptional regulator